MTTFPQWLQGLGPHMFTLILNLFPILLKNNISSYTTPVHPPKKKNIHKKYNVIWHWPGANYLLDLIVHYSWVHFDVVVF